MSVTLTQLLEKVPCELLLSPSLAADLLSTRLCMTRFSLRHMILQTADWDKDERYMATSDLCAELQKDVKIDANMERRICSAVLKQLDDTSNDVQSIAVKW
jgi:hypothetical protein